MSLIVQKMLFGLYLGLNVVWWIWRKKVVSIVCEITDEIGAHMMVCQNPQVQVVWIYGFHL